MKKFLSSLILISGLIFNLQAVAEDHDHGDEHEGWPENTLLALEGQDAISKEDCLLFITDVGFTGSEKTDDQFYAVVQTSYSHNQDHAEAITVKTVPGKSGVLMGLGANGQDQIALFLDPQVLDLKNIKSFNLRWLHGNHFHNNRCVNMTVHEHEDENHN